jgi:uncharacterized membrane protein
MAEGEAAETVLFEAVIMPHRSLSRRGLAILIGVVCGFSLLTMLRFWLIGAWMVVPFSVIEIGLFLFLFRLNVLRARASEMLLLGETGMRVIRTDWRGRRQEQRIPAGWMNVLLRESPGRVPRLLLTHRGQEVEVAAFLGEDAKLDLAAALRDALDRIRNPRFDNPQLRD